MGTVAPHVAMINLALIGIGIGIVISTPIGPVNLMVIRNTLNYGIAEGLAACAGVIVGDACFALIAAFGISALSDTIKQNAYTMQTIGGCLITTIGIIALFAKPKWEESKILNIDENFTPIQAMQSATTTFILTITNPATLMLFIVLFGGVGGFSIQIDGYINAAIIIVSVITGTLIWWGTIFFGLVTFLKEKINIKIITSINKTTAVIIILFGLFMILKAII